MLIFPILIHESVKLLSSSILSTDLLQPNQHLKMVIWKKMSLMRTPVQSAGVHFFFQFSLAPAVIFSAQNVCGGSCFTVMLMLALIRFHSALHVDRPAAISA